MIRIFYFMWLLLFPFLSYTQNQNSTEKKDLTAESMFDLRRNAVYNEDILAFAYERLLPVNERFAFALKAGFMIWDPIIPVFEVAAVTGGPLHFFEGGMGAMPDISGWDNDEEGGFGFVTFRIGYRYQARKGFLCKVSAIYSPDNFILPLISLGYAF